MSGYSHQSGFTLVEVLIALAIVGIALAAGMRVRKVAWILCVNRFLPIRSMPIFVL